MTTYLSTYSSDLKDGGDCDDNFVKLPSSKNKTGKPPITRTGSHLHIVNEYMWFTIDCESLEFSKVCLA
jgi:hypothetical protein